VNHSGCYGGRLLRDLKFECPYQPFFCGEKLSNDESNSGVTPISWKKQKINRKAAKS
jgi:hypothetical protein